MWWYVYVYGVCIDREADRSIIALLSRSEIDEAASYYASSLVIPFYLVIPSHSFFS